MNHLINQKMEKFLKNPLYTGIAIFGILLILVLWVWDEKKNPQKDFFGLLKTNTPTV
jgi:hypothetical protein